MQSDVHVININMYLGVHMKPLTFIEVCFESLLFHINIHLVTKTSPLSSSGMLW